MDDDQACSAKNLHCGVSNLSIKKDFPSRALKCFLGLANMDSLSEYSETLVLGAIDLLIRCGHCIEDVCLVLAHTSSYYLDVHSRCGTRMDPTEIGNVIVVLIYIAHIHVLDQTCPLKVWHEMLFLGRCRIHTLDKATMKLLKVRGYVLRVDEDDLDTRLRHLLQAAVG